MINTCLGINVIKFIPLPRFQNSNLEYVISCIHFCHFSTQTCFINFLLRITPWNIPAHPFPKSRHVIHHMIRSLPSGVLTNPKAIQTNQWDGMTSSVSNFATSPRVLSDNDVAYTTYLRDHDTKSPPSLSFCGIPLKTRLVEVSTMTRPLSVYC